MTAASAGILHQPPLLAVWGRNITDANYSNSNLFLPTGTAVNYDPARTYGVELSLEF